MCSYIIQTLQETPNLDTLYYFCSSQDRVHTSAQMLRSLGLQLLRRHLDTASLICNEYVYRGSNCGIAQLRSLIPKLLEVSSYTRIVIDGLDKCPTDSQKAVLKDLQNLCLSKNMYCKILFSSRKEAHLANKLSSKPQISLDGRYEVNLDIRLYVKHKMQKLRSIDTVLLNRIESILVEKANGMVAYLNP
jgi:hypothetical protein